MIRNPDGSSYTIPSSNPIMTNQETWDELILHNMIFEEISYHPKSIRIRKDVVIAESPPATLVLPERNPTKLFCHVLPTVYKDSVDPLYGEKITRMTYGEKFTMEVSLLSTNNTFCNLWTNSIKEINPGSIIFIKDDKQWWKVNESKKDKEGIIINCVISDKTPSF